MMLRQPRRIARVAGIAGLLLLAGCQVELFSALPESEANEMVAILLRDGLNASKTKAKDGSDIVLVEKSQFAQAVNVLRSHGYPRHKFSSMGDVFQPSGLVASPMQEQARFLWALSQELSSTISEIDGVLTARVQVVLPDNDLLKRDPTPSSASVFVRYDEASALSTLVPQIKALVANSVQGLTYDRVSVVLVPVPAAPPIEQPPRQVPAIDDQIGGAIAGGGVILAMAAIGLLFRRRISALLASVRPESSRGSAVGPAE